MDLGKPTYTNDDINILEELRTRLNDYCHAVNTVVGESGVTPYEALGALVFYQTTNKEVKFPKIAIENMENWSKEEYRKKLSVVEELQYVIKNMGLPSKHTFWGSKKKVVLPPDMDELTERTEASIEKLITLSHKAQQYTTEVNYGQVTNLPSTVVFFHSLQRLVDSPNLESVDLHSKKLA
ncbi:MAG: hypothetical protein LRY73_07540 [Bacillus sp. (in: Bacteria)]|nr:hypothetical protein [Bacillus sp. (in: firmicutes)]